MNRLMISNYRHSWTSTCLMDLKLPAFHLIGKEKIYSIKMESEGKILNVCWTIATYCYFIKIFLAIISAHFLLLLHLRPPERNASLIVQQFYLMTFIVCYYRDFIHADQGDIHWNILNCLKINITTTNLPFEKFTEI